MQLCCLTVWPCCYKWSAMILQMFECTEFYIADVKLEELESSYSGLFSCGGVFSPRTDSCV